MLLHNYWTGMIPGSEGLLQADALRVQRERKDFLMQTAEAGSADPRETQSIQVAEHIFPSSMSLKEI